MQMLLYHTANGPVAQADGKLVLLNTAWDELINRSRLDDYLIVQVREAAGTQILAELPERLLPPIGKQELWAAGVTYFRSRTARMEEAEGAGGGDFYDRVYDAARPELFLKATAQRVVGPGGSMKLRSDSRWIVPEPELVLVINSRQEVVGYTVGNDLSCRDIEGENPLYLPQAKTFDRCAALGPAVFVTGSPPAKETRVGLTVLRGDDVVIDDSTTLAQMKRNPIELVDWLFKESSYPDGCLLMTGTGIVPSTEFTLQAGDVVRITIDGIGTLVNAMD